jgi:hypothetical protein
MNAPMYICGLRRIAGGSIACEEYPSPLNVRVSVVDQACEPWDKLQSE